MNKSVLCERYSNCHSGATVSGTVVQKVGPRCSSFQNQKKKKGLFLTKTKEHEQKARQSRISKILLAMKTANKTRLWTNYDSKTMRQESDLTRLIIGMKRYMCKDSAMNESEPGN